MIKIDGSGDWIEKTKKFCYAAHPENKREVWDSYFNKDDPIHKEWGQSEYPISMSGWNQSSHLEFTEPMLNEFFDRIPAIFDKKEGKGRFVCTSYFSYLAPSHRTDDDFIQKYQDLLDKTLKDDPENSTFIKCLKGKVSAMKTVAKGIAASEAYIKIQTEKADKEAAEAKKDRI